MPQPLARGAHSSLIGTLTDLRATLTEGFEQLRSEGEDTPRQHTA
ncbi:hypothetical protein [Streptomyces scopuliridis]